MTKEFAERIAVLTGREEAANAMALGYSPTAALFSGYAVMDEVFDLAMAPDRPLITLPMRKVWRK